jgi:hypothetical protein
MDAIKAADLFADADSPKMAAQRHDEYLVSLNKSLNSGATSPNEAPRVDPTTQLEQLAINKSLAPEAVAALNTALAAQRSASADIIKDITLTSPLSTSFAQFDLEAPSKLLTPRPTPLRNKLVRKKGIGTSHRVKRVTGFTGTGTGGQGQIFPGVTESTTTTFGSIAFQRGPKISYTADDLNVPYFSYSLSDAVSWDANYSALGFQDLRQLSTTSTLYAAMLMEERMLLMSRGTAAGLSGALAAPTVTLTQTAAGTGETGLANATYFVYATSDAGAFGESVSSTVQSITITGTQVLNVTVNNVAGSLGTKVYIGTTTGNANAKLQGRFTGLTGRVIGSGSTLNDNIIYSTTSTTTAPTADTSAYATGYDGIIPQILAGGVVSDINSQFSTANPGVEFQNIFGTLWDNVKGDPDEIWLNGSDRKQLSDSIKNGSTANYRLNLNQTETGDYVGGAVIGGLNNEVTGKLVNLAVHPWLPQGVAPVLSYTLPIPDTQVSDVWAVVNVQDYQGVQWPVTQFAYENSVYWRGTLVGYAPAWNGIVTGIKAG